MSMSKVNKIKEFSVFSKKCLVEIKGMGMNI